MNKDVLEEPRLHNWVIEDSYYGTSNIQGYILEDCLTYLTIRPKGSLCNVVLYKRLILDHSIQQEP